MAIRVLGISVSSVQSLRFAFTRAARVIDILDLRCTERAIEDFYFVNQPAKKIAGTTATRAKLKGVDAVGGRNTRGRPIQVAIEIDLKVRSIKGSGDLMESARCNQNGSRHR